ncbi:MAG: endopeptidase La [Alphaproteobacteria bacterium]|nr:endopeptidase La [Alphaproteobacteria bacterium]MBQ7284816.1 endopeptidase La [Alphaproteobacteria bacterium]
MTKKNEKYPVLPLRDIVVYPKMIVPLFVGRDKSIRALQEVVNGDQNIVLVTQKDASVEEPNSNDIYKVGTLGTVLQLLKLPDGTVKVLVEGLERVKLDKIYNDDFMTANITVMPDMPIEDKETEGAARAVLSQFEEYVKLSKKTPPEVLVAVNQIDDYSKLADTIASHLALKISDKQALLEGATLSERFEKILEFMDAEITLLEVENKIRNRVKKQMEKSQKEYYLNEQMKAIQKELGDDEDDEISNYMKRIEKTKLSKEAKDKALTEVKKLKSMSAMSSEATVVRNYLDWILDIPWKKRSKVNKELDKAMEILEADHYGLDKVKERIIEYLAVQARADKVKGPILCLVGPPGVGKTSLGKSIAKATGRSFVRASLGGMRDEAEIRGHRRTYIGSMPGKIVKGMKKAGTSNPLFLLDEIDKLGNDYRGDPSSALLEVLDPEQNQTFNDHYLEVDYDLSDVMFVTTANSLDMPRPLLDRMEIIRLSGYTEDEKVEIAKRHLIPKIFAENAVKSTELNITDDAVRSVIRYYTREAGVRNLERELATIARKAVKETLLSNKAKKIEVTEKNIDKYLGVIKYRFGEMEEKDHVGVTTGLAWTEVGGDILFIEAVDMPGKGIIKQTGKLGEVMKESIETAYSVVRSHSKELGITSELFEKTDIHVHVPEGATPKDGPSAGIAMYTTLVSVLTKIPVRKDVAMTGEITLQGRVLPIGGLKEKLLSALRGGIKTVIIPKDNEKDLAEIPDNVKKGLKIIPVANVKEVLKIALNGKIKPLKDKN